MSQLRLRIALLSLALLPLVVSGCKSPEETRRERAQIPTVANLEHASRRLPMLLDGLVYHADKLQLADASPVRRATFFSMLQDAREAESLIRPLPNAAKFPGKPGRDLEALAMRALDQATALQEAAQNHEQEAATAAAEELREQALALLEHIAAWRPVLSAKPERRS